MNLKFSILLLVCCFALIQSCAIEPKNITRQDPLIGKIISTKIKKEIDFQNLCEDLFKKDIIYLSEKHNNPEHHNIQLSIINAFLENKQKPVIAFEFFSIHDTPLLLNYIDSGKVTHSKKNEKIIEKVLRKKLGWDRNDDKMWGYYYSILKLAKTNNLNAIGIDFSESQTRRLTRKGSDGLLDIEKKQIYQSGFSNKNYKEYMYKIFEDVHCGMGSPKMQSRLYGTWIARNDRMALSLTQAVSQKNNTPVIVIIGGGHTEYNLGVVERVKALNPELLQVNLGLVEISVTPSDLIDYLEPLDLKGFEPVPAYDYIWFTQRVSYKDPCKEFKKSLKRMKKK